MTDIGDVKMDGKEIALWLDHVSHGAYFKIRDLFPEAKAVYAVGGSVRDYFLERVPQDLDITISGITTKDLFRIPGLKTNYFGGGMAMVHGVPVDIWPLESSAIFEGTSIPRTIHGLLSAFDFNLERIAVEARTGELIDLGCRAGIQAQTIDYDPINPKDDIIQAARLVLLREKTGFALSDGAQELLRKGSVWARDDKEWDKVMEYFIAGQKYVTFAPEIRDELLREFKAPADMDDPKIDDPAAYR